MMKTILVSAFTNINDQNSRMLAIIKRLDGVKSVITTDFNHRKKMYYSDDEKNNKQQIHLHVPAYSNNLSIKRIWSHLIFAKKLRKYLNELGNTLDVVYCTMPSSSSAYVCAKYCRKHRIKFIIDVIDLWPDSLLPFVKVKSLIKVIFYPWSYLSRYAYKHADVILGESKKYANEAKRFNNNATVFPLYLGVDMSIIREIENHNPVKIIKPNDEIWIAYAGSLGTSYGFDTLLNAIKSINGKHNYKLWFVGDGVEREYIESFIKENNLNAEITGFLSYESLLGYLSYCDIAINIFKKGSKVVYSYKFNDYVATDCFVLNSLDGETAEMVDEFMIGKNFNYYDHPLETVLEDVLLKWDKYSKWKGNSIKLIEEKLDKDKIYSMIPEIFCSLM